VSANPKDDLISVLVSGHVDGEKLSELEVNMFCMTLLVAGNETTRTLIANGLLALAHILSSGAARRASGADVVCGRGAAALGSTDHELLPHRNA